MKVQEEWDVRRSRILFLEPLDYTQLPTPSSGDDLDPLASDQSVS